MLTWEDAAIEPGTAVESTHSRGRLAALAAVVILGASFGLASMRTTRDQETPASFRPTAAQTSLAQRVALTEANSMNPDTYALAVTDNWPANVTSVSFTGTTREAAFLLTGASPAPGDRDVLVIQMRGRFRFIGPGVPSGVYPVTIRSVVTLVVDANNGDVIDIEAANSAPNLANSVPLRI